MSYGPSLYHGARNDYTYTSIILESHFPITQDICYTGLSGRNSFVYFRRLHRYFRRQSPGAFLGTTKETKTPLWHLLGPRFEWLEVA